MPCFSEHFYIVGCPCCSTSASLVAQGLCCLLRGWISLWALQSPLSYFPMLPSPLHKLFSLFLQEASLEYPPVMLMPSTMAQVSRCLFIFGS